MFGPMFVDYTPVAKAGPLGLALLVNSIPQWAAPLTAHQQALTRHLHGGEGAADPELLRGILRAEVLAFLSICDESLWVDFGLQPMLRQEVTEGQNDLVRRTAQPEAQRVRQIRERLQSAAEHLLRADPAELLQLAQAQGGDQTELPAQTKRWATEQFLAGLQRDPTTRDLPDVLQRRINEVWFDRGRAAIRALLSDGKSTLRSAFERSVLRLPTEPNPTDLNAALAALPAEDLAVGERFDELRRQSWRLDEVLGQIDKLRLQAASTPSGRKALALPVGSERRWPRPALIASLAVWFGIAGIGSAIWIANSPSSGWLSNALASRRAAKLEGLPKALLHIAAWLGPEPIPAELWNIDFASWPALPGIDGTPTPDEVNAALVTLRDARLAQADLHGWVFAPGARTAFRQPDSEHFAWWQRAVDSAIRATPSLDEGPDAIPRWNAMAPHLVALFDSGRELKNAEPQMRRLVGAITTAMLAHRADPTAPWETNFAPTRVTSALADNAEKAWNRLAETAGPYLEQELTRIESTPGTPTATVAGTHRLLAEFAWRKREVKKEQHALIRAIRAVDQMVPPDKHLVAFLQVRLGISRAIGNDPEGGEEAFAEAIKTARELHDQASPGLTRTQLSIARFYARLREFKPAWRYYQEAIGTSVATHPRPSRETADLLGEAGDFLLDHGQFSEASLLFRRGVEILRQIEPPTSPLLSTALAARGEGAILADDLAAGEVDLREALDLAKRESGPESPATILRENRLADALLAVNDPAKAAEALRLVEARIAAGRRDDDREDAIRRGLYARALLQCHRGPEALSHFEAAIKTLGHAQNRPSLFFAGCLRDFGQALAEAGRRRDGERAVLDAEKELLAVIAQGPRQARAANRLLETVRERLAELR